MRGEVHPLCTCLCVPSESWSRQTGAGCDISQELSGLRDFHLLSLKLQPEVLGAGTPGGVGFVPALRSASFTGPGDRAKCSLLGWSAQPWCMRRARAGTYKLPWVHRCPSRPGPGALQAAGGARGAHSPEWRGAALGAVTERFPGSASATEWLNAAREGFLLPSSPQNCSNILSRSIRRTR